jgi:hypothetical protein
MTDTDLAVPAILDRTNALPAMVSRAAQMLASARTAAEVLEARVMASVVYDTAKRAARLSAAQGAFNEIRAKLTRTQADALEIEAAANRRLADEYDAAQERGEVQKHGGQGKRDIPDGNIPSVADIGISAKAIHGAREIRDAEEAEPGIVHRIMEEALAAGEEPTRAKVKRAVKEKSKRKRGPRMVHSAPAESQHDRDLRMLMGVWEAACQSARDAFLETVVN